MNHQHHLNDQPQGFWNSRYSIGLVVFAGVVAYFLLTEHRAHVFYALPYLLLLFCPLMHLFMHGGHAGHDQSQQNRPETNNDPTRSQTGDPT